MDDPRDVGGEPEARAPGTEPFDGLARAIERERAAGGGRITDPPAPEAHRRAIEGLIAMGGSDPTAKAPPRRRMW